MFALLLRPPSALHLMGSSGRIVSNQDTSYLPLSYPLSSFLLPFVTVAPVQRLRHGGMRKPLLSRRGSLLFVPEL